MTQPVYARHIMRIHSTRLIVAAAALALVAGAAGEAAARPRPAQLHSDFEANKTFGLGIMLGSPTGLSGKWFVGAAEAIDFGIGFIGRYGRHRDGLHIHADYLWHPVTLVKTEPFYLPLYVGIGGRFWDYDYDDDGNDNFEGSALGLRLPAGIAFDFNEIPLDAFFELAFVLDLFLNDDYGDDLGVDLSAAVGVRYWFD
jgi:hypothetical protein